LDFYVSKQSSAANKLYLAYTGKLKISGTAVLAAIHDEHTADYDNHSERTFKMKDVKVVQYTDILPNQEYCCDKAGKNCGMVQPLVVFAWVTIQFAVENPTPPPKTGTGGYGYGYSPYGGRGRNGW